MRRVSKALTVLFLLPAGLLAQHWEVGASGGYSFFSDMKVTAGAASGTTGFGPGPVFGGVLANALNSRFAGEIRYAFIKDEMRVSSGSSRATATSQSHALHYDVLIHATNAESSFRPFLALGAGIKMFRGTGDEPSYQPLSNLIVLTHASQTVPLISAGGGIKIPVSKRALVRMDIRDYISPVPDKLLATPSGTIGGWTHNIVVQFGVSTIF